jgi:hypothetical protein
LLLQINFTGCFALNCVVDPILFRFPWILFRIYENQPSYEQTNIGKQ